MSTETQNQDQATSSATDPTSATLPAPPVEAPWLTFPPFPEPPEGVTIIPFSQFKPNGLFIRMDEEDGPEIDPLGIPTVTLGVKHALTEEEQARKRKKKKTATKTAGGVVKKLLWFEEWEEGEHVRRCIVNPYAYSLYTFILFFSVSMLIWPRKDNYLEPIVFIKLARTLGPQPLGRGHHPPQVLRSSGML